MISPVFKPLKVSVALCTYNGSAFLNGQLDSIFNQQAPVDEIVICDDGSKDQTPAIIREYQSRYPGKMRFLENDQNLGGRKNFEKAFGLCTGDVIFFCDQDDVWHPDKVAVTLRYFEANPQCWAVATDADLIDGDGRAKGSSFWNTLNFYKDDLANLSQHSLCAYTLSFQNIVAGAMLAVRSEAKSVITPFQFPAGIWHDEWIVTILSSMGKIALLPEKLVAYRVHEGQQIGVGKNSREWYNYIAVLKDRNSLQTKPLTHLFHTSNAYQKLLEIQRVKPELDLGAIRVVLYNWLQDAKKAFLSHQNIFMRKARLVKWYLNKEFATTLDDVLSL